MRKASILLILCLMANMAAALNTPHPIAGAVYQDNTVDYAVGATVSAKNSRTGETILDIVAASGYFENIDAANFPSGYQTGDQIIITASYRGGRFIGTSDVRISSSPAQIVTIYLESSYVGEPIYLNESDMITLYPTTTTLPPMAITVPAQPEIQIAEIKPVYFQDGKPVQTTTATTQTTMTTTAPKIVEQKPILDQIIDFIGGLLPF